jgi:hypothetical protein
VDFRHAYVTLYILAAIMALLLDALYE